MAEEFSKTQRGPASAKAPITRHPLFPAIVALWFGALFGLGSLAIRPAALDSIVAVTHISAFIPSAAPPLGVTARILLALAMAGMGGFLGAVVARRIAQPKVGTYQRRRAASGVSGDAPGALMRSDYADDSAGDDNGFEPAVSMSAMAAPQKRRALALSEDANALDLHDLAPLPGSSDLTAHVIPEHVIPEEDAVEPENVVQAAAPIAIQESDEPAAPVIAAQDAEPEPAEYTPDAKVSQEPAPEQTPAPVFLTTTQPLAPLTRTAAERIASDSLDALAPIELVERLAIALEQRRKRVTDSAAARADEIKAQAIAVAAAPTSEELPAPVPEGTSEPVSPAVLPLPAMPPALRPLAFDDDEDDEQIDFAFSLPPRRFAAPDAVIEPMKHDAIEPPVARPASDEDDEDETDEESRVLEEGYSSLLGLSRPAQPRPFVRVEEPDDSDGMAEPVVIFPNQGVRSAETTPPAEPAEKPATNPAAARPFDNPGQPAANRGDIAQPASAQDPDEAERALRAALATLQRMSGAA